MTVTKENVFIAVGRAIKLAQVELEKTGRGYGALEIALKRSHIENAYFSQHGTDSDTMLITKRIMELTEDGLISLVNEDEDEHTSAYLTSDGLAHYNWIKTK